MLSGRHRHIHVLDLRIPALLALSVLIVFPASSALGQVIPGIDFNTDATFDTDADARWEDTTLGNPSGFDFEMDTGNGVTRNTGVSAGISGIDAAYDFPGLLTGNVGGALLSNTGSGTRRSFQNAPGDWTNNEDVTIEIWFKPANLQGDDSPTNGSILFEDGGGTGLGFFVDNNELRLRKAPGGGNVGSNISGISSDFIQAVGTFDNAGGIELYINGASVGTDNPAGNDWSGGDAAAVGTRGQANTGGIGGGQSATESLDGEVAIFRVYRNQILTSQQVLNNYNSVLNGVFLDTSGDWSTAANWLGDVEPTATDNAYVNNGLTATITATGEVASNVAVGSPDGAGGSGQLNITGGDLTITNNFQLGGNLDTGSNLRGNVTQNDGDVVVGGDLVFGGAALTEGGNYLLRGGTLTVDGDIVETNSNVDTAQLYVDDPGSPLTMTNNGDITVQSFRVGDAQTGDQTLSGGTDLTTTGTLLVGRAAVGELTLDGGTHSAANMTVSDASGGAGSILTLQNGASLTTGAPDIGDATGSDGTININSGSTLTSTAAMQLGQAGTAKGTINVNDGLLDINAGGLFIAGDATTDGSTTGAVTVGASGQVDVNGGNTEVGHGGTGTLTINGGDFNQNTNNLVLAQSGGTAGGTVTINSGTLDVGDGVGSNSDLNMNGGTGDSLFDHNGGDVFVERDLQMATSNTAGSEATYNLDAGAGSLDIGRHLIVGGDRVGEFNYESGTFSIGGTIYVGGDTAGGAGANPNADGTINIGSLGGTPTMNTGQFEVGRHNVGVVNQDDGTVNVNSGNLVISQLANSNGTYNLNDGDLNVTNLLNVNTGTGTFNVNGGTATIGGNINLSNNNATGNAEVNVAGGDLIVNGNIDYRNNGTDTVNVSAGSLDLTGGNIIGATGTNDFNLSGTGTLKDVNIMGVDLDQSGGLLKIGAASGADTLDLMTINGDYNQTGGVLEIELNSLADLGDQTPDDAVGSDFLDVSGNALLAGEIKLITIDGFAFDNLDVLDVLTADDITLDPDFSIDVSMVDGINSFLVTTVSGGNGEILRLIAIIPEPSTLVLGLIGLLGLGFYRPRRRRG